MTNNVGVTTTVLPRTIGDTIVLDTVSEVNSVTIISGVMDVGCILFDSDGTLGVCTEFSRDENNNPIYTIRTSSINTEIDIQAMLSRSY